MEEILKKLDIQSLTEEKQDEIKTKLNDVVQLKVDEQVKDKESELKNSLTEQYEEKFNEYKNDLTEKFSNFLDEVLDEELQIPDHIKEYARKGQLYSDIIDNLKVRIGIDEGLLDQEAKEIMSEAKDEITNLQSEQNKLISENMELKSDAKELSAHIYLTEKCNELTVPQKEKAMKLLEGVKDKEEIDRKVSVIVESEDDTSDDDSNDDDNLNENNGNEGNDLNENNVFTYWSQVLSQGK